MKTAKREFLKIAERLGHTVTAARKWYDSPEYEAPKSTRMAMADTNLMIVEGA